MSGETIVVVHGAGPPALYASVIAQMTEWGAIVHAPFFVDFSTVTTSSNAIDDAIDALVGYVRGTNAPNTFAYPIPGTDPPQYTSIPSNTVPLRDVTLVCNSWGGMLCMNAFDILKNEAHTIRRIVLYDTIVPLPGQSYAETNPQPLGSSAYDLVFNDVEPSTARTFGLTSFDGWPWQLSMHKPTHKHNVTASDLTNRISVILGDNDNHAGFRNGMDGRLYGLAQLNIEYFRLIRTPGGHLGVSILGDVWIATHALWNAIRHL